MATTADKQPASSSAYRLAKLLKHIENRQCADCSAALLEWQNYYGSLKFQVWLCNTCYETHEQVLDKSMLQGKRIKDPWTSEEVQIMEKAGSNARRNELYERFTSADWVKITQESSFVERSRWVRAKYFSKYFMIPPMPEIATGRRASTMKSGNSFTLPMRTADYFITLSAGKPKGKVKLSSPQDVLGLHFSAEISSCTPEQSFYKDQPSPVPELLGLMVFPQGMTLSDHEKRPSLFSFVLTDMNRIQQFGVVLVVHELLDPSVLERMLTQRRGSSARRESTVEESLEGGAVYYVPKALVLLSHYPFYHLFSRFLAEIYHVSLSSSPLPIERYIANFMLEIPLPPQGRIEVVYSLPSSTVHVSRPPRNQMPMVDFSYRPLFALLSVDNILTIFSCLCQEMSICICCSNLALLTPIQEALLSLLFPLVWQGCYVPVLPQDMLELLHAPVPLLAGVQCDRISDVMEDDPAMRSSTLIIVHVDTNTIHYGSDCQPLPLPKGLLQKLKQKVHECGSCLFQSPDELAVLESAGTPYPNDEHLTPLRQFVGTQGVLSNIAPNNRTASSERATGSANKRLSIPGMQGLNRDTADDASDFGGSVASTTVGSRKPRVSRLYSSTTTKQTKKGLRNSAACTLDPNHSPAPASGRRFALDPHFNMHQEAEGEQGFDAVEIRWAFLRFLVAALLDYQDYFKNYANSAKGSEGGGASFDVERFRAGQDDPFMKHLIQSQMFANFVNERIETPDQPEIKFFDEHILAKRNRSTFKMSKALTPFLDDDRENVQKSFTVPAPVSSGVAPGQTFCYNHGFPVLEKGQISSVVRERSLASTGGAGALLVREYGQPDVSRLQGESLVHMRDRAKLMLGPVVAKTPSVALPASASAKNAALTTRRMNMDMDEVEGESEEEGEDERAEDAFFCAARRRFERAEKGVVRLQSVSRAIPCRRQQTLYREARQRLRRWLMALTLTRVILRRIRSKAAARLQWYMRAAVVRRRYLRSMAAVRAIQTVFRLFVVCRAFRTRRRRVVRVQAWYRASSLRRTLRLSVSRDWVPWRRQLMYLWSLEGTSLLFRSSFYSTLSTPTFLHQALHRQELRRLYQSLGLYAAKGKPLVPIDAPFPEQFRVAQNTPLLLKLAALHTSQDNSGADLARHTNSILMEAYGGAGGDKEAILKRLLSQRADVARERGELYRALKEDPRANDRFFESFSLGSLKKRKQKLADICWLCCSEDFAQMSSLVVCDVLLRASEGSGGISDRARLLKLQRVSHNCAETAKACLSSLQKQHKHKQ